MHLDDYFARKTSDLYLEDLPYILHSSWAISKLKYDMSLNRYSHHSTFNSFGFCEKLIFNLKNGKSVLIKNFPRNKEILGILDYKDFPKQDLPLFLKCRLHELIEHQIKKPVVGVFYPNNFQETPRELYEESERTCIQLQANKAERRELVLAKQKVISDAAMDAVHYIGGGLKAVGDSITGSIDALINEPSIIADVAENVASTVVDGAAYFPDTIVNAVIPEFSSGAKDRTNQRINNLIDGTGDTFEQAKNNYIKYSQALEAGDFEGAGSIVGGYVSSVVLPTKKVKILGMASINLETFNFGAYLKAGVGKPPEGMPNPHAHHILFKRGLGEKQQALVFEGQELLRKYEIDPILGFENLIWAPNRIKGQHNINALEQVVGTLKLTDEMFGARDEMVNALKLLGKTAAERR